MASGSVTFKYTGASQTFVVPAGVSQVKVQCWGAPGGTGNVLDVTSQNGIRGDIGAYAITPITDQASVGSGAFGTRSLVGYVAGLLSVSAGDLLTIIVGGGGGYGNSNVVGGQGSATNGGPGGWGGGYFDGGAGGHWLQGSVFASAANPGSGGGGGSGIFYPSAGFTPPSFPVCVAGGGGGAGGMTNPLTGAAIVPTISTAANPTAPIPPFALTVDYTPNSGAYYGGPGGGLVAASGGSTVALSGGAGGTQSSPGMGGAKGATGHFASSNAGNPGVLGVGGAGANIHTSSLNTSPGGGGGGGGYFGGGGGSDDGSGGGGGSNMPAVLSIANALTLPVSFSGVNPQGPNGKIIISWSTQAPNTPTILEPIANKEANISAPLDLKWAFSSSASGAIQGGFDVEYQTSTGSGFTVVSQPGNTATSYVIPAATWATAQTITIGVRVYDQFGAVSGYATRTITTIAGPALPTISSPATNGTIATSAFTVAFTQPSGSPLALYRGKIIDANGNVLWDTGNVQGSRLNLCPNPSFEVDTSSWTVSAGSIATSTTFVKHLGTDTSVNSGKVTWPTANALTAYAAVNFATLPGETYVVSTWLTVGNATTDPQPQVAVCNVGSEAAPFAFATVSPVGNGNGVAGTFVLTQLQFVALATTTRFLVMNAQNVTAGAVCYIDKLIFEQRDAVPQGPPAATFYFDGGGSGGVFGGTFSWIGTTGKSTSKCVNTDPASFPVSSWPYASQTGLTVEVKYSAIGVGDQTFSGYKTSTNVTINVAPPGTPTAVVTSDATNGKISIAITNSNTPNATVSNDVYRTDLTNGTPEIRIGTGIAPNATFVDYTPATNVSYGYRVRALSAAGGYADVS